MCGSVVRLYTTNLLLVLCYTIHYTQEVLSNYIQIKIGTESYDVEVGDISVSPVNVTINGNIYSVDILSLILLFINS